MDYEDVERKFDLIKGDYDIKFNAKKEQIQVATSVLNGRNVIGFLPTGFGKTLCLIIPTILKQEEDTITLIISPLTSLIDDHLSTLQSWNISCAKIGPDMEESVRKDISKGEFKVIFSSPESILKPHWKKMFLSNIWQSRVMLIGIDEAHCISEWGDSFRKDYQELSVLKSFFSVPIMALTGTSTKKVQSDIYNFLHLPDDETDVIFKSPDRPNIYLELKKRDSTEIEEYMNWLIEHIKKNGINSKKCIIYCRSIDRVSDLFVTLKECLGLCAYVNQIKHPQNIMIEMFHKSTHEDSKERILKEFKKETSTIRCIMWH